MTSMDEQRDTDASIDAALEELSRVEPSAGHVERVLARSGPGTGGGAVQVRAERLRGLVVAALRPRWALPVAATVVVILAASWEIGGSRVSLPQIARANATEVAAYRLEPWGTPRDIVRPVLPPEMYWAMDPFAEFATLRPPRAAGALDAAARSVVARIQPADDEIGPVNAMANTASPVFDPGAAGLEPIGIAPIEASTLDLEIFPASDAIELPAIALDAIVIAPLTDEEIP